LTKKGVGFLTPLPVNHGENCNFTTGFATPVDFSCVFPSYREIDPFVVFPPDITINPESGDVTSFWKKNETILVISAIVLASLVVLLIYCCWRNKCRKMNTQVKN
jgi:hypothetical protein